MSMPLSLARRISSGRVTLADLREEAERTLGAKKAQRKRTAPKRAAREAVEVRERKTKTDRRREVYAAVDARSGGICEHVTVPGGFGNVAMEHDHFWGRGKEEETPATVWHLCGNCHHNKTRNRPDRSYWILAFRDHAERHGLSAQVAKCDRALALELAQHPSPPASPQETP